MLRTHVIFSGAKRLLPSPVRQQLAARQELRSVACHFLFTTNGCGAGPRTDGWFFLDCDLGDCFCRDFAESACAEEVSLGSGMSKNTPVVSPGETVAIYPPSDGVRIPSSTNC